MTHIKIFSYHPSAHAVGMKKLKLAGATTAAPNLISILLSRKLLGQVFGILKIIIIISSADVKTSHVSLVDITESCLSFMLAHITLN